MSRRKISTTVYLTPEQDAALKALSARTKVPMAEYVRQGVDMLLRKQLEREKDDALGVNWPVLFVGGRGS